MASSINASTSGAGGVITTADSSGILNLQSGGTTVATINSTGIVMASNTAPTFSAYVTTGQTGISNYTNTKITFDTEEFDTNNNFTSSRFTPTVAGYYQINSNIEVPINSTNGLVKSIIYKNGSSYKQGTSASGNGGTYASGSVSGLVYCNGSTDYVEIYVYGANAAGSTFNISGGIAATYFQAFLARSA